MEIDDLPELPALVQTEIYDSDWQGPNSPEDSAYGDSDDLDSDAASGQGGVLLTGGQAEASQIGASETPSGIETQNVSPSSPWIGEELTIIDNFCPRSLVRWDILHDRIEAERKRPRVMEEPEMIDSHVLYLPGVSRAARAVQAQNLFAAALL